ncbi:NAD-binding protein [Cristinia sonorae]|uniref:NAD-binding protein n=1 Tax=Cristinia sonorae TaxID=1940300 RepID=A0A8K0UGR3_9AGAR|nr:NAD-binding protein [Cristinia sonorae]
MAQPTPITPSATRVAIVTGGAQGLGEVIALRLADENVDVAVLDIPSKEQQMLEVVEKIKAKGRRAISISADVTDEQQVKAAIDQCVDKLGNLDIMIANAGILHLGTILDTSVEQWDRVYDVNVRGLMLCYKHAAIQMIKQGRGGRIIGACSSSGKRGVPGMAAYSSSKFAVRGITQIAAQEWGQYNISVNAYAPGFVATPMLAHEEDGKLGGYGEYLKKLTNMPPGYEFPEPTTVSELVAYLVKPDSYVLTGECVNLCGTWTFD